MMKFMITSVGKVITLITSPSFVRMEDDFDNYGWLTRDDGSSSSTIDVNLTALNSLHLPRKTSFLLMISLESKPTP
jgi:hypothetical protein